MTKYYDFDNKENYGVQVCTSTTRPTAYLGRHIFETNTKKTMKCTNVAGPVWEDVSGGGGGTKKIFIPWTYTTGFTETYNGDFAALSVDQNTDAGCRGNIQIPPDFSSGAKVYAIIKSTETDTGAAELFIDYGAVGENTTRHAASGGGTIGLTANQIAKSAEISLSSASAGDFVGIYLRIASALNDCTLIYFYGFVLEYEA